MIKNKHINIKIKRNNFFTKKYFSEKSLKDDHMLLKKKRVTK